MNNAITALRNLAVWAKQAADNVEAEKPAPIDMVLHCPQCHEQHIDIPKVIDVQDGGEIGWTNPPHRSHLCHNCGCIWRPADVPTNGVAKVTTRGKNDTWEPK